MSHYYEWNDNFSSVYLEDSYVTNIMEEDDNLIFNIEFVLNDKNPLYKKPKNNEQYCYHKGKLIFSGVSHKTWLRKTLNQFHDVNGEVDFGNIDVLQKTDKKTYNISGDWGNLSLESSSISIILE